MASPYSSESDAGGNRRETIGSALEKAAVEVGRAKARLIMAKVKLENAALRLRKESKALVLQHVSDNIDDRQHEQTFRVGPVSEAARKHEKASIKVRLAEKKLGITKSDFKAAKKQYCAVIAKSDSDVSDD